MELIKHGANARSRGNIVNGQIIQKTVIQFAAQVGFDNELEDFLNVQNNGTNPGHYKLEFKNLGSE